MYVSIKQNSFFVCLFVCLSHYLFFFFFHFQLRIRLRELTGLDFEDQRLTGLPDDVTDEVRGSVSATTVISTGSLFT